MNCNVQAEDGFFGELIGLLKKKNNNNYVNVRISYILEHTRRVAENKLQFHQEAWFNIKDCLKCIRCFRIYSKEREYAITSFDVLDFKCLEEGS